MRMQHGECDRVARARRAARGAVVAFCVAGALLVALVICVTYGAPSALSREGAVRAWYLPVGVLLVAVRAGARREARRVLSLALLLLGIGALTARAYDARGAEARPDAEGAPPGCS
jgi:peptidoglycan/LPS O-acetylase OafA/YrhL